MRAGPMQGQETPAAFGQAWLYMSTGGGTGVARWSDLRVMATAVPGGSVVVTPGTGVLAQRSAGQPTGKSWLLTLGEVLYLTVPANNSGATVTWQIIARPLDPEVAGNPAGGGPSDPCMIIETVSALPSSAHLWLATVTMPASTGTVAQSQITDRRSMAQPASDRELVTHAMPPGEWDVADVTANFAMFPHPVAEFAIPVPAWASEANIVGTWGQAAYYTAGSNRTQLAVLLGAGRADAITTESSWSVIADSAGPQRLTITASDAIRVPHGWRGQTINAQFVARKMTGNVELYCDEWSSLVLDIQWREAPALEGTW